MIADLCHREGTTHTDLTLPEGPVDTSQPLNPAHRAPESPRVLPVMCLSSALKPGSAHTTCCHTRPTAVTSSRFQLGETPYSAGSLSSPSRCLPPTSLFPDRQLRSYLQVRSVKRKLRYYLPKYFGGLRDHFSPALRNAAVRSAIFLAAGSAQTN